MPQHIYLRGGKPLVPHIEKVVDMDSHALGNVHPCTEFVPIKLGIGYCVDELQNLLLGFVDQDLVSKLVTDQKSFVETLDLLNVSFDIQGEDLGVVDGDFIIRVPNGEELFGLDVLEAI